MTETLEGKSLLRLAYAFSQGEEVTFPKLQPRQAITLEPCSHTAKVLAVDLIDGKWVYRGSHYKIIPEQVTLHPLESFYPRPRFRQGDACIADSEIGNVELIALTMSGFSSNSLVYVTTPNLSHVYLAHPSVLKKVSNFF